ncbi:MAG: outer-membrane lipoprotein carrier protein LolA [Candidatus Magnetoovum sp. WYHC-5]|nr:outer-membrane lipoprotein carrier protein LolA [Candidatus Magnetoovum sp. WYHC-5]
MLRKVMSFVVSYVLFFMLSPGCGGTPPLNAADREVRLRTVDVLKPIIDSYNTFKDIKGQFKQRSVIKDMDKEMKYEGEFFIKIPSKMFWHYSGADKQEVYINGGTMTFYQEKQNQAVRTKYDEKTIGQTPLALLSDLNGAIKNYKATQMAGYIRLIPNDEQLNITYIDIYTSEGQFPIKRIIVKDKSANEIEIDVFNIATNTHIEDSTFVFTAPKGVNVVDN